MLGFRDRKDFKKCGNQLFIFVRFRGFHEILLCPFKQSRLLLWCISHIERLGVVLVGMESRGLSLQKPQEWASLGDGLQEREVEKLHLSWILSLGDQKMVILMEIRKLQGKLMRLFVVESMGVSGRGKKGLTKQYRLYKGVSRSWVFRFLQTTSEMYHPNVTRGELHFCQWYFHPRTFVGMQKTKVFHLAPQQLRLIWAQGLYGFPENSSL